MSQVTAFLCFHFTMSHDDRLFVLPATNCKPHPHASHKFPKILQYPLLTIANFWNCAIKVKLLISSSRAGSCLLAAFISQTTCLVFWNFTSPFSLPVLFDYILVSWRHNNKRGRAKFRNLGRLCFVTVAKYILHLTIVLSDERLKLRRYFIARFKLKIFH